MSLLRGKQPVLVIPRDNAPSQQRGTKVWEVTGAPTYLRCAMQPVREWSTSEESFTDGIQMLDLRRMFSREWTGDINSHVIHDGGLYESVGAPQHQQTSRRTKHFAVTLRNIGSPLRSELDQCAVFLGIPSAGTDDEMLAAVFAEAYRLWKLERGIG